MKALAASMASLAAVGLIAGAGGAAFACDFGVTAQASPVTGQVARPATKIDPVHLAQLEKAAILPIAPREERVEETEAN